MWLFCVYLHFSSHLMSKKQSLLSMFPCKFRFKKYFYFSFLSFIFIFLSLRFFIYSIYIALLLVVCFFHTSRYKLKYIVVIFLLTLFFIIHRQNFIAFEWEVQSNNAIYFTLVQAWRWYVDIQ